MRSTLSTPTKLGLLVIALAGCGEEIEPEEPVRVRLGDFGSRGITFPVEGETRQAFIVAVSTTAPVGSTLPIRMLWNLRREGDFERYPELWPIPADVLRPVGVTIEGDGEDAEPVLVPNGVVTEDGMIAFEVKAASMALVIELEMTSEGARSSECELVNVMAEAVGFGDGRGLRAWFDGTRPLRPNLIRRNRNSLRLTVGSRSEVISTDQKVVLEVPRDDSWPIYLSALDSSGRATQIANGMCKTWLDGQETNGGSWATGLLFGPVVASYPGRAEQQYSGRCIVYDDRHLTCMRSWSTPGVEFFEDPAYEPMLLEVDFEINVVDPE